MKRNDEINNTDNVYKWKKKKKKTCEQSSVLESKI